MAEELEIIRGGTHSDERGTIYFVNDFDMSSVQRMYIISHADTNIRRAWRGHRLEQRWFYVVQGSFELSLIKIDNWEIPDRNLKIIAYILSADQPQVIHVPKGFASDLKSLLPDSKILVYADSLIADAVNDNYQYPSDYFNNRI